MPGDRVGRGTDVVRGKMHATHPDSRCATRSSMNESRGRLANRRADSASIGRCRPRRQERPRRSRVRVEDIDGVVVRRDGVQLDVEIALERIDVDGDV